MSVVRLFHVLVLICIAHGYVFSPARAIAKAEDLCPQLVKKPLAPSQCSPKARKSCSSEDRSVSAVLDYGFTATNPREARDQLREELKQMSEHEIDFAIVKYTLPKELLDDPEAEEKPTYLGLSSVFEAYEEAVCANESVPALALYFQPAALSSRDDRLDVSTEDGRETLYRALASYFCRSPAHSRALVDGRPLIFVGSFGLAEGVKADLFDYLGNRLQTDFGFVPYFVRNRDDLKFASIDPESDRLEQKVRERELTFDQVQQKILGFDEFYQLSGGTPEGYFKRVAEKLLRPDRAAALKGLKGQANSRQERTEFLARLYRSKLLREINSFWIVTWYKLYLGRQELFDELRLSLARPSSRFPRLDHWLNIMELGANHNVPRAEILSSDEFYEKAGHDPEVFVRRLHELLNIGCPESGVIGWIDMLKRRGLLSDTDRNIPKYIRREISTRLLLYRAVSGDLGFLAAHLLDRSPGWPGFTPTHFAEGAEKCAEYSGAASIGAADITVYEENWETVLRMDPRPAMVVLVTWNNFFKTHPDTVDEHFGPKFLEMTKKYASRFKNGTSCIS